jgi:beta-glucosidase-like glycosyl hydrolase
MRNSGSAAEQVENDPHRLLSREVARESLVLLKNKNRRATIGE